MPMARLRFARREVGLRLLLVVLVAALVADHGATHERLTVPRYHGHGPGREDSRRTPGTGRPCSRAAGAAGGRPRLHRRVGPLGGLRKVRLWHSTAARRTGAAEPAPTDRRGTGGGRVRRGVRSAAGRRAVRRAARRRAVAGPAPQPQARARPVRGRRPRPGAGAAPTRRWCTPTGGGRGRTARAGPGSVAPRRRAPGFRARRSSTAPRSGCRSRRTTCDPRRAPRPHPDIDTQHAVSISAERSVTVIVPRLPHLGSPTRLASLATLPVRPRASPRLLSQSRLHAGWGGVNRSMARTTMTVTPRSRGHHDADRDVPLAQFFLDVQLRGDPLEHLEAEGQHRDAEQPERRRPPVSEMPSISMFQCSANRVMVVSGVECLVFRVSPSVSALGERDRTRIMRSGETRNTKHSNTNRSRPPAGDRQHLPGDVAALLARQEQHRVGDVVRRAEPPSGDLPSGTRPSPPA